MYCLSASNPPFNALPGILEHFSLASWHGVSFNNRGTLEEEGAFLPGPGVLFVPEACGTPGSARLQLGQRHHPYGWLPSKFHVMVPPTRGRLAPQRVASQESSAPPNTHPSPAPHKWLPLVSQRAAPQQVLPTPHFSEHLHPLGHSCALSNKIWISAVAGEGEDVAPSHRFAPSWGALIQPEDSLFVLLLYSLEVFFTT